HTRSTGCAQAAPPVSAYLAGSDKRSLLPSGAWAPVIAGRRAISVLSHWERQRRAPVSAYSCTNVVAFPKDANGITGFLLAFTSELVWNLPCTTMARIFGSRNHTSRGGRHEEGSSRCIGTTFC